MRNPSPDISESHRISFETDESNSKLSIIFLVNFSVIKALIDEEYKI